jgi:hypothetical protein
MNRPAWHHYPDISVGSLVQLPTFSMCPEGEAADISRARAVPFELVEVDTVGVTHVRWVGRIPRGPEDIPHPIDEGDVVGIWVPSTRPDTTEPRLVRAEVTYIEPDPHAMEAAGAWGEQGIVPTLPHLVHVTAQLW